MLVLVEDVREARVRLLELDHASGIELVAEVEEEPGDLGAPVELRLDPREDASALPERAFLSGAAIRVARGDQLDRAERPVRRFRLHGASVDADAGPAIGACADRAAGTYGPCDDPGVDVFDLDVRRHVYFAIVANGRPPTASEAAAALGCDERGAEDAFQRLHDAHALVLFPDTRAIWMANPFCFAPTPHRVRAGGRYWTGTCAWDALGIPAALHGDGVVESECACCGERLGLEVVDGELVVGRDVLVHFLVPARSWWDDIGFT